MTPEQLDEIEQRANRATEGPWVWEATSPRMSGEQWNLRISGKHGIRMVVSEYQHGPANAKFITSARTDVPALVAEVRRLRGQIAAVKEALSGHPKCDRYEESEGISCGWKSAVHTITYALEEEADE